MRHGARKASRPPSADGEELVAKLSDACPRLRRFAQDVHGRDGFPVAILDWLRDNSFLATPLPADERNVSTTLIHPVREFKLGPLSAPSPGPR